MRQPTFSEAYYSGREEARIQALVKNGQVTTLPETPVSRWWLVVPLLVLALAALVAVFGTGPGKVRALPQMNEGGYQK